MEVMYGQIGKSGHREQHQRLRKVAGRPFACFEFLPGFTGVTLFVLVTGHLPFLLPVPNDILYRHIFCMDYVSYWRKRNIKVSPNFMELFDNLVAFDPAQRPSISEIRQSKWMKEIKWELKDELKKELIRRENLKEQNNMMVKQQNNVDMNNKNEKVKNVDDILAKIKERKKIEVV